MADPRQRIPLQSSLSYTATSAEEVSARPLKRRYASSGPDPAYFTPSISSFQPRPYLPHIAQHPQRTHRAPEHSERPNATSDIIPLAPPPRTNMIARNHSLNVSGIQSMDVHPSDLGVVFIHPPFTVFPDAEKYKDGLTYNLMAAHPDWFLDPEDFVYPGNSNTTAITYPSQLEPPRGWCPAKKKDLKDGWPEGEEPRLRCTFCRRNYAGVNAKSMWRRHVYEKHKIAMSNRRDTQDRKGGRGANKENSQSKENTKSTGRTTRRALKDTEQDSAKFQLSRPENMDWNESSLAGSSRLQEDTDEDEAPTNFATQLSLDDHSGPEGELDHFQTVNFSSTPPLTPGFSPSKSSHSERFQRIPESPYDPLVTPSFRHSPPRLPSDQPWRFPSPSHPLHSSARDLSLCMLVRGEASPLVSGLDVSPLVIVPPSERKKRSIFSSPFVTSSTKDAKGFPIPSPRRLFYDGIVPSFDQSPFRDFKIPESPLGRPFSAKKRRSTLSEAVHSWQTDIPFSPAKSTTSTGTGTGLLGPIELQSEDPFADPGLINSWIDLSGAAESSSRPQTSQAAALPPDESPVVRSTSQQAKAAGSLSSSSRGLSGLGMGLMDAFLSGKGKAKSQAESSSSDEEDDPTGGRFLGSPIQVGKKTRREFMSGWLRDGDGDTEMGEAQPKKRRRTINGRN